MRIMQHALNDPIYDENGQKLKPWKKAFYQESYQQMNRDLSQESYQWYIKTIWKSITSVLTMNQILNSQSIHQICADCGSYLNLMPLTKERYWRQKHHDEQLPRAYKYFKEHIHLIQSRYNDGQLQYLYCYKCFTYPMAKEQGRFQKTGYDIYEREFSQPDQLKCIKSRRELHAIMIGKVSSFITDRSNKHDFIQSYPFMKGHMSSYLHDGRLGAYWQDLFGEHKPWWDTLQHFTNEKQHISTAIDYLKQYNHLYKIHYANYELLCILSANPSLANVLKQFKDNRSANLYKILQPSLANPLNMDQQLLLKDGDVTYLLPVDVTYKDPLLVEHGIRGQQTALEVGSKDEIDKLLKSFDAMNFQESPQMNLDGILNEIEKEKEVLQSFHRNKLFYSHPFIEEFLFPTLYPHGKGGFNNSYLQLGHDLSQYIKMRILSCRTEYRKCIEWIFWMLDRLQKERMISFSKIPMVMPANYDSTRQLKDLLQTVDKSFYSIFGKHLSRKMNDTRKYFFTKYHSLRQLISHFNRAPDLFLTLTMNEQDTHYTELRKSYSSNPEKPVITKKDPLLAVVHFYVKVRTALKIAFDKNNGLFGKIEGKFEKLEMTERGSPHVHILLWVDEETRLKLDDGFMVQAVIPEEDGILRERVLKHQIHRCIPERCYKDRESRQCRFGYPFSQCLKDSMANNRWIYRRGPIDSWVVPYNPLLTLIYDGNHCLLRMTQSDASKYMLKYVAKTNKTVDLLIGNKNAIRDQNEVVEYLTTRIVHIQQAVWQLLNLPMVITKPKVTFVEVSLPQRKIRRLRKPEFAMSQDDVSDEDSQLDIRDYLEKNEGGLGEEWENLFEQGLLQRYYTRPDFYEWDSMTFKQFIENGSYTTVKNNIPKYLLATEERPAQYKSVVVRGKTIYYFKKKTPVISQFKKFWPEQGDVYFYSMILQRLAHRESDFFDRKNQSKTYMEECFIRSLLKTSDYDTVDEARAFWKTTPCNRMMMYDMFKKMLVDPTISQIKKEKYQVHQDALSDLLDDDQIFNNVQGENPERLQPMHSQLVQDYLDEAYKEDEDQMRQIIKTTGYNPIVVPVLLEDLLRGMTENQMSDSQKAVISYLHHYIHYLDEQVLLFITGGAGTGKSRLVEWIRVLVEHVLFKRLDVTASTGQAAANISGITIHSLLQLKETMTEAWIDPNSPFQKKLELIDVLLIDEISMIDAATFELINDVLQKAHVTDRKRKVLPFGGKHIIIVGDLMQLLPFKEYDSEKPKNIIITSDSFKLFNWIILESNFRQSGDQKYGQMLDRIRFGQQTELDIAVLKSIEVDQNQCIDPTGMFLCATNVQKQKYNQDTIQRLFGSKIPTILIKAVDQEVTNYDDLPQIIDRDIAEPLILKQINDTFEKDLLTEIHIKIGMRVMITKNLMVSMFQTNGTLARIVDVDPKQKYITIFNETKGLSRPIQHIGKICLSASVNGRHFTRLQFPIVPAYASTVHKAQGQTLDKVFADFQNIFAYGQVYTMLSRVRKLADLQILNFDPSAFKSSEFLTQMYEAKFSQSYNMHKNHLLDEIIRNCINAIISAYQKHPPQSKELVQRIRQRIENEKMVTLERVLPPFSQEEENQDSKIEESKEEPPQIPIHLKNDDDDDYIMIDTTASRKQ